jgi:flagellar assembly factor FliW
MPLVATKYFGNKDCVEESVFDFPFGLPAFENERRFVFIEAPDHAPLVFLQSIATAGLCFPALPIQVVDSGYELAISPEDLEALELDPYRQPRNGSEILALALVALRDGSLATANLMAPVIVNLKTRRALQAIRRDSGYSHQFPVQPRNAEKACEEAC